MHCWERCARSKRPSIRITFSIPGKIIPDGRFAIDTNLRFTPGDGLKLPFQPVLAFAAKDESFTRQPRAVQRVRRLPQGNAHHVPDLPGHGR